MITFRLKSITKANQYTLEELCELRDIFVDAREQITDWCDLRRREYLDCKGCEYIHLCHDITQATLHLDREIESGDYE